MTLQQDNCCRQKTGLWMVGGPLAWWSGNLTGLFVPGRVPVLALGAVDYAIIAAGEAVDWLNLYRPEVFLSLIVHPFQSNPALLRLDWPYPIL
jgi:hypothetical protein